MCPNAVMKVVNVKIALAIPVSVQSTIPVLRNVNNFHPSLDKCCLLVYTGFNTLIGFSIFGGLAQLVERNVCNVEVSSSNLLSSTKNMGKLSIGEPN